MRDPLCEDKKTYVRATAFSTSSNGYSYSYGTPQLALDLGKGETLGVARSGSDCNSGVIFCSNSPPGYRAWGSSLNLKAQSVPFGCFGGRGGGSFYAKYANDDGTFTQRYISAANSGLSCYGGRPRETNSVISYEFSPVPFSDA